ncbi:tetratricopeptide repeat protein [Hyphococcus formosus]|uniref:tetratricopeptide repeat protein n=1 Tax=Hyphococcus formosus TaxID=3143534 RepID=UPI00398AEEA6
MANEDETILREVDQELAEERQWAMFRKHGPAVIGAAIAIVVGVAGWQVWNHLETSKAEKLAIEFLDAVETLEEDPTLGRAELEKVAEAKGGYGALASLRRAGSYAANGERLKAIETYRELAASDAPRRVRELAQIRAGYLSLADGRDVVMSDLGNLPEATGPFGYHAREVMALAALFEEDYEVALSSFRALSIDLGAPEGVRGRAEELAALAEAAKSGVNITGETRVDDLLKAVGEATAPAETSDTAPTDSENTDSENSAAEPVDAPEDTPSDDHADHNHEE